MTPLNMLKAIVDILQTEIDSNILDEDRVFIFNQKFKAPTDDEMYVVIQSLSSKVFGSKSQLQSNGEMEQTMNVVEQLSIDIISKNTDALNYRYDILMALSSVYAEQKMNELSFRIFNVPTSLPALSTPDGAAIPYRFNATVAVQYMVSRTKAVDYFDTFAEPEVTTDP